MTASRLRDGGVGETHTVVGHLASHKTAVEAAQAAADRAHRLQSIATSLAIAAIAAEAETSITHPLASTHPETNAMMVGVEEPPPRL